MSARSNKGESVRVLATLAAVGCLLMAVACGGGSNNNTTSTITTVGASCNPTAITAGQTSTCTATVSGTGSFSTTVSWTASGFGTITPAGGIFTASSVPFTQQVTITATSTQDTTKSGSTTITVAAAGTVTGVTASCSPTSIQTGQLTACTATVQGNGNFSPNVDWSANGGTINPITGLFSSSGSGNFTITATSQQNSQVTGTAPVTVATGANNQLPIVVDAGPPGLTTTDANVSFVTINICVPNTNTCQTIDHVIVDTGSIGVRVLAKAGGGELDPAVVPLPQQTLNGSVVAQCNQFVDGFTWGSVSLATVQLTQPSGGQAGETANTPPGAISAGLPIQLIGDPTIPSVPASCSSGGLIDESNLQGLGANGVLGLGNFEQDCGPGCVSNNSVPNVYYACSGGSCSPTLLGLPQQITNPTWVLPADNNGTLVQLPSVPAGGTTTVTGNLYFGIGTQTNNALGSATVFDTDANAFFNTTFNGVKNSCSFIDSGSNANFFPASGYPNLTTCPAPNQSFYCPPVNLSPLVLSAQNQSASNTNGSQGTVNFNVGNANALFAANNGMNTAISELGSTNSPINGCGSFDWGLSFFYGRSVFTGIELQPVTGTSYVGPFWAY
jgi:hypothetical protein